MKDRVRWEQGTRRKDGPGGREGRRNDDGVCGGGRVCILGLYSVCVQLILRMSEEKTQKLEKNLPKGRKVREARLK